MKKIDIQKILISAIEEGEFVFIKNKWENKLRSPRQVILVNDDMFVTISPFKTFLYTEHDYEDISEIEIKSSFSKISQLRTIEEALIEYRDKKKRQKRIETKSILQSPKLKDHKELPIIGDQEKEEIMALYYKAQKLGINVKSIIENLLKNFK